MRRKWIRPAGLSAACLILTSTICSAGGQYGPGVSDTEIKIGNTMPYSGPASSYGTIGQSDAAYFAMINERGGINGRKINFISRDDGYSPPKTVEQVRRLVEQDQVLLLFNTFGTPPNSAIQRYLNDAKVPHLFIATGAKGGTIPHTFPGPLAGRPAIGSRHASGLATSSRASPTPKSRCSIRTMISGWTTLPVCATGSATRPTR